MFKLDFTDRIVLVTGASRGIGRAISLAFAELGAKVYGTATSDKGASDITAYLEGRGQGLVMNATDRDSIDELFKQVSALAGAAPEILVNNAGLTRDTLFIRMKDEDWQTVLQCDLNAHVQLTKLCVSAMMKKRWGRVISITSVVGETGNAGQCNYAAAKAGLAGFSKSLAKEVGSRGITVNCVAPGFVKTDMTAVLSEEQTAEWEKQIPLKRAATPEDIAGAVIYLASDLGSYVTGSTLDVNGGMYCN